ncbi:hypothetical protein [Zarconia navalis]|uniref:hypothetical protein n=1 Tax=Zarconia navalis TaxID=2992134 RepID=UPI0021F88EAE|nr:hypothetical protein [Zarconia navalis]
MQLNTPDRFSDGHSSNSDPFDPNRPNTPITPVFPEIADIETASENYANRFAGEIGKWFLRIQAEAILKP